MTKKATSTKNLKDKLLKAALKEIKSNGAHGLSLRHVAKTAGCTPMATYRHFSSKEALIAEIAREGFMHLHREMMSVTAEAEQSLNALQKLELVGMRYIHMALEKPEHLLMMFGGFIQNHEQFAELKNSGDSAFFSLVDLMKLAQKEKLLPKIDPVQQALAAWSIVHGFSMLLINGNLEFLGINLKNYQQHGHFISKVIIDGLKNLKSA